MKPAKLARARPLPSSHVEQASTLLNKDMPSLIQSDCDADIDKDCSVPRNASLFFDNQTEVANTPTQKKKKLTKVARRGTRNSRPQFCCSLVGDTTVQITADLSGQQNSKCTISVPSLNSPQPSFVPPPPRLGSSVALCMTSKSSLGTSMVLVSTKKLNLKRLRTF